MKKRIISLGWGIGIFMAMVMVSYAVTNLFFTKSQTSDFSKKKIFQFDLDTGLSSGEVGPGDSFSVSPVIFNEATEEMYVFIKIDMPETEDGTLYSFDVDDEYTAIDDINITITGYAIGTEDMSTNPVDSWNECKTIGNIE